MKKISLSIGIVALNEEQNIKYLLDSIKTQKETNFKINTIYIVSDGSTDDTVKIVRNYKDTRIKLITYKKRIGKSAHLNTLFQKVNDEIIVLFDADVILSSPLTIEHLIRPLKNEKVGLTGGNPQPIAGTTFLEKAVNLTFKAYDPLRTEFNNGNTPYGCDGRILGVKKNLFKKVTVPHDTIANDAYLFFSCVTKGFQFKHVRLAKVWYRSPTIIADQIRQNKRFVASHYRLAWQFGKEMVSHYYDVPFSVKFKLMICQFLKHPIPSAFIYCINVYCTFRAIREERKMTALWPIAYTSKGGISND